MRVVLQRVREAQVRVADRVVGAIGVGLVVLVAVETTDTEADARWLAGKIVRLRIFPDECGLMNRAISDVAGEILVVSQFTLYASTKKGNRPSYLRSAPPEIARPRFEQFRQFLSTELGRPLAAGEFGADMQIQLINDGPVTIILDSQHRE